MVQHDDVAAVDHLAATAVGPRGGHARPLKFVLGGRFAPRRKCAAGGCRAQGSNEGRTRVEPDGSHG
ncbi:MAG: hypothetical protein Q8K88_01690 [Bradyrhizobium sp.]|nr:hypothetical protein [Bradyrhizobium sp.]